MRFRYKKQAIFLKDFEENEQSFNESQVNFYYFLINRRLQI